jgi:hypothetical protein
VCAGLDTSSHLLLVKDHIRWSRSTLLVAGIAVAAALFLGAYANSWRNSFHFDDAHVIVSNPAIASLANVPRFFTDARTFSSLPANQTYRPLVSLTLAVGHAVARATTGNGLDPRPYHVTQLLLVALTAILLGVLALRLFTTGVSEGAPFEHWPPGAATSGGSTGANSVARQPGCPVQSTAFGAVKESDRQPASSTPAIASAASVRGPTHRNRQQAAAGAGGTKDNSPKRHRMDINLE